MLGCAFEHIKENREDSLRDSDDPESSQSSNNNDPSSSSEDSDSDSYSKARDLSSSGSLTFGDENSPSSSSSSSGEENDDQQQRKRRGMNKLAKKGKIKPNPPISLIKPTPLAKYGEFPDLQAFLQFMTHAMSYIKYGLVQKEHQVLMISEFLTS